jgi:hypothetical protein
MEMMLKLWGEKKNLAESSKEGYGPKKGCFPNDNKYFDEQQNRD